MNDWLSGRRPSLPVHAIGTVALLLGVVHVVVDDDPLVPELAESFILFSFAGAVFWVGHRITAEGVGPRDALRIATVALAGGLAVGLLAATFVVSRLASGEPITELEYVLSIGWCIGVASGALVAHYVLRMKRSVSAQADLAKRLTILQRVLRHNLRNELTIIGGATHDAQAVVEDPEVARRLDVIERHVQKVLRLSDMSGRLTRVWRTEATVELDVDGVVREEVERFRDEFPDVPLTAELSAGTSVMAHPDTNLAVREALQNAVVHNEGVEVWVLTRGPGPGEEFATVQVRDDGSGVPESELEPLWARGEGPLAHTTGLGLWLIFWLVESADGELSVESDERGTAVTMRFPVA